MAQTTTASPVLPQMRLRGDDPAIEVSASNLRFVLGEASAGPASVSLLQGASPDDCAAFLHVAQRPGLGVVDTLLCVTDKKSTPQTLWETPTMSFRTFADVEEARIDGGGLSCRSLTAGSFTNLVSDYTSDNTLLPPSAAALSSAYIALSTMVVLSSGLGGTGTGTGTGATPVLVDSYVSTSVLSPPTANALRAAYFNLSNTLAINTHQLSVSLPSMVKSAVVTLLSTALLSNTSRTTSTTTTTLPAVSGSNVQTFITNTTNNTMISVEASASSAAQFTLSNDVFILSTPDNQPRALLQTNGATVAVSPGSGDATAFRWYSSSMSKDLMAMSANGNLSMTGGVTAAGDATISGSCTVAGTLAVGAMLQVKPEYVGVNLSPGQVPSATLHVNGTMFATEQIFALSDRAVKTDIKPIPQATEKVMRIRGCSYLRTDHGPDAPEGAGKRQVGVIAQDVHSVLPEAVQVGTDGRMSVAYGNLVALALEAIREVSLHQGRIERRLQRMESRRRSRVCIAAFVRRRAGQRGVG